MFRCLLLFIHMFLYFKALCSNYSYTHTHTHVWKNTVFPFPLPLNFTSNLGRPRLPQVCLIPLNPNHSIEQPLTLNIPTPARSSHNPPPPPQLLTVPQWERVALMDAADGLFPWSFQPRKGQKLGLHMKCML